MANTDTLVKMIPNTVTANISDFRKELVTLECNKNLSILHVNARSCASDSTFDEIKTLIDDCDGDVDIMVLSETWFKHNELCLYDLRGYECSHSCRRLQRGGGLSVYIKQPCDITEQLIYENSTNIVHLRLKNYVGINALNIVGVYRPPDMRNMNDFLTSLENIINNTNGENLLLLGDMNIDLHLHEQMNDRNRVIAEKYRNMLCSLGLVQCNFNTTREASDTLIDHLFSNMTGARKHRINTIKCDFSDHNIIMATIEAPLKCNKVIEINCMKYKKLATLVQQNITNMPMNTNDPNIQYNALENIIVNAMARSRSTKTVRPRQYKQCAWIQEYPNILQLIKQKRNLWRKHKTEIHTNTCRLEVTHRLKEINTKLHDVKKCAKKIYYDDLFRNCQNSKEM